MWNRTKRRKSMLFSNPKLRPHVPMRQWRSMGNVFIVWNSQKKCIVTLPWMNAYFTSVFLMGNCIIWNIWETSFVTAMWTYYVDNSQQCKKSLDSNIFSCLKPHSTKSNYKYNFEIFETLSPFTHTHLHFVQKVRSH